MQHAAPGDVQRSRVPKLDTRRLLYDHPRHIAVRDALGLSEHVLSVPFVRCHLRQGTPQRPDFAEKFGDVKCKNSTCNLVL